MDVRSTLALKSASDPALLVSDPLRDLYCEAMSVDGKTDPALLMLGLRRTCIMLMECQADMLAHFDSKILKVIKGIRDKASKIVTEWKPKLDDLDIDASSENSPEVHAFLQLLATFDIAGQFDKDEICKLIPSVADLCRVLKLQNEMPGVVDVLVKNGRQTEVVICACSFA